MTGSELAKALRETADFVDGRASVNGLDVEVIPGAHLWVISPSAERMRRHRLRGDSVTKASQVRNEKRNESVANQRHKSVTDPPSLPLDPDPGSGSAPDPDSSGLRSSSEDLTGSPRVARKRGWRRVRQDFEPNETHRQIATKRGVDLAEELEKFKDYEFARPRVDEDATFRTWLRRAEPARNGARHIGVTRFPNKSEVSVANAMAVVRKYEAEERGQ